ncbi:MAG: hypothetical protein AAF438_19110, partial [Pseudomonadota bacterium]
AIRQCAYGSPQVFQVLSNPSDFSDLKSLMASATEPAERYLVSVGVSRPYPAQHLEAWLKAEPNSPDALLCYGARLLQYSWSTRGYSRGHEISEGSAKLFFESLKQTKEVLMRCTEVAPEDPTPWAYLIMASTWHTDDIETRSVYFQEATKRDPNNWPAHMHMTVALSEKWGGDNEDMKHFAEGVARDADEGSDLPIVLLKSYIEYWKYLDTFKEQHQQAEEFLNFEWIQERAQDAYNKSLGSPQHVDTSTSIFARYNASSWFWIVRNKDYLKKELDILGNKIEDIHWRWAGSEGHLDHARDWAGSDPGF